MREIKDIINVINEVVETCRSNSFCDICPYWNKKKGECQIQMKAKVENTPDMW